MKRLNLKLWILISLFLFSCKVFAADLLEVYARAFCCDPTLRKARATRLAQGEQLPQQVAALLPTANFSANANWNRNVTLRADPPASIPPGATTFPTKAYLFSFNQPLFNLSSWYLKNRAEAVDKQAQAALFAASQDLMVRVTRAYLEALNAQDNVRYTRAENEANLKQYQFAERRYKLGVDIITTVYNAKAAYDVSTGQLIAAENTQRNTLLALTLLTGCVYDYISPLRGPVPLLEPQPFNAEEWVCAATSHNWNILSSRYRALAARERIKASFSDHLPTLSMAASYGPSYGQSTGLVDTINTAVGLQLNVPMFQGGLVVSQTRQAQDEYVEALAEVDNQYLQAVTTTRQRFNDVLNGIRNLRADKITVASTQQSLLSTEKAFKFGTRSIFDVLAAQRELYRAQRQYANDQYAYLLNTIILKQATGCLTTVDLAYINHLLV